MKFRMEVIVLSLWVVESRCLIAETQLPSPMRISLFYETHCPDCREFMVNQLCPTWQSLKEVMNIRLIPFGNAEEIQEGQNWQFRCQHGVAECQGNTIQTCIMHYLENATFYMPVICCMESASSVLTEAQREHSEQLQHQAETDLFNLVCKTYTGAEGCDLRDSI
ncbi:gamma-interferon-inducible lysosomal thiol reductase-like isoform X3 [Heterodontus francisci]|uniref:gamma-interferon-inducible lysosomal thiol reductase-like isoform X3 n=1 Tax=Heterodontus francisci TaxID=7792 RepID=UPI00355C1694